MGSCVRTSRPLILPRRASARPMGAEDAAVARFRSENRSACRALVEVQAGVGWHGLRLLVAAVRAGQGCRQDGHARDFKVSATQSPSNAYGANGTITAT